MMISQKGKKIINDLPSKEQRRKGKDNERLEMAIDAPHTDDVVDAGGIEIRKRSKLDRDF